jgi:hypothetical protein
MTSDEIKFLLQEVFFEGEYKILGYSDVNRFYVKVYSEKLKNHIPIIRIENYVEENITHVDIWEMIWSLPNQNYYMKIPNGDTKAFLMISKEKLKDILLIHKLNDNLISDMVEMDKNPIELIRDFKLNNLV